MATEPALKSKEERSISERFGEVMKVVRQKRGISQEKLAELAEIDRTYVIMIERGMRHPTLEVAQKIANCLNIKLSEMIRRAERCSVKAAR